MPLGHSDQCHVVLSTSDYPQCLADKFGICCAQSLKLVPGTSQCLPQHAQVKTCCQTLLKTVAIASREEEVFLKRQVSHLPHLVFTGHHDQDDCTSQGGPG